MSTNTNLPAGLFITTINGKRCTAVPRSLTTIAGSAATSTSAGAAVTTTRDTSSSETTTPSVQAQETPSSPAESVSSPTAAATAIPEVSTSQTPTPSHPQVTPVLTATSIPVVTTSASLSSPAPTTTSPRDTESSTSSTSTARIDLGPESAQTFNIQNGFPSVTEPGASDATSNPTVPAESSTSPSISKSRASPGPMAGGVIGGLALVGLVAFLFWFFKRRRRYRSDSLLTPLGSADGDSFNGSNRGSIDPEKFGAKFGASGEYQTGRIKDTAASIAAGIGVFGASLKSKVTRDRSNTPSVNLNRGNSQFFDGPIPQHSRNNSTLSESNEHHTVKDCFNDLWERVSESMPFNWSFKRRNNGLVGPYTASRFTEEHATTNSGPSFSQILRADGLGGQRATMSGGNAPELSALNLGSLGLNFDSNDPFADPLLPVASIAERNLRNNNPFADPTQPGSSVQNPSTYIANVRRSRGQSTNTIKINTAASRSSSASRPGSRYPSSISLDRDSYRDTVFSSLSASGRKGKGRSDPFDLERPELWNRPKPNNNNNNTSASQNNIRTSSRATTRGSSTVFPDPLRMSSVHENVTVTNAQQHSVQRTHTISSVNTASLYSSGVPSLSGWAGPGPDLGPGSIHSSVQGNTSSDGESLFRSNPGGTIYPESGGVIKGSLTEMNQALASQREVHNVSPLSIERGWDAKRQAENTSPVSMVSKSSSIKGVGRAM